MAWLERAGLGWWRGPRGVRAGWRVAGFVLLAVGLLVLCIALLPRAWLVALAPGGRVTTGFVLLNELLLLGPVCAASVVMLRLEGRGFAACGLAGRRRAAWFGKGLAAGFALISLVILAIVAAGYARLSWGGLSAPAAGWFALAWLAPSLLTGLAEELALRGYLLQTLSRGLGFWPALAITSVLFGILHLSNSGEGLIGVVSVMLAGAILALGVRGTGSLWWSIGLHGAWDYAENFLWGAPDSGQLCAGTLLHLAPRGPAWLSGGATGPEGSLLAMPLLAAFLLLVWRSFGRGRA